MGRRKSLHVTARSRDEAARMRNALRLCWAGCKAEIDRRFAEAMEQLRALAERLGT